MTHDLELDLSGTEHYGTHLGADVPCRVLPAGQGDVPFAPLDATRQRPAMFYFGFAPKIDLGDAATIDFLRINARLADDAGHDVYFIDARLRDVGVVAFAAPHCGALAGDVDVEAMVARAGDIVAAHNAEQKIKPRKQQADVDAAATTADDEILDALDNLTSGAPSTGWFCVFCSHTSTGADSGVFRLAAPVTSRCRCCRTCEVDRARRATQRRRSARATSRRSRRGGQTGQRYRL